MYLISYDISSDRLRAKVAKMMEGYGVRVQYSVFECILNEKKYHELYRKLAELTADMSDGSIRFYYICGNCEGKISEIGQISAQRKQMSEELIIV